MKDFTNSTIQFLTAKAVGKILSLSPRTIWRLRSTGQLPKPIKIGGAVRWRLSDIEKHFENKDVKK
jgi:predicted DNA-binding transcriptional regulator AlpA